MPFRPQFLEAVARRERAHWARYMYETALKSKYKPNGKSVEIIGIPSAVFTHITTDATPGSLTQTTFDTDSRADSAQILLTNSTGASKVIIAAWIRGKPVTRYSDSSKPVNTIYNSILRGGDGSGGFLHDKFVDYESIAKNGERVFETGNNFTVTAAQVNQLADYYWKLNKTKKHIYTLSLVGFQSWYEPGEWYTLQIGGAGQEEYIDSTVECFDVRCSLAAGGAPSTSVAFREVEENWKFDSNEVARQIAAGDFSRRPSQNVVTVAAQYYSGYADYYCDGTDDQEEIKNATSYLNGIGGTVKLTKGNYNISSSITLYDNISLLGEGGGTTLKVVASGIYCVSAIGSAGCYIKNVSVANIGFTIATSINSVSNVAFSYVENSYIMDNVVTKLDGFAIRLLNCNSIQVLHNTIDGGFATSLSQTSGIWTQNDITSLANIVQGNTVKNVRSDNTISAIDVDQANSGAGDIVINNTVDDIISYKTSSTFCAGIAITGFRTYASSNKVSGVKGVSTSTTDVYGILIWSGSDQVRIANNLCYNNGADTDMANTNRQNFYDDGTDTQWAG